MKFGIRTPSPKRSIKARTTGAAKRSLRRKVSPGYGSKGVGWIKNPKRAAYNHVYHRTTRSAGDVAKVTRKSDGAKVVTASERRSASGQSERPKWPIQTWLIYIALAVVFAIALFNLEQCVGKALFGG